MRTGTNNNIYLSYQAPDDVIVINTINYTNMVLFNREGGEHTLCPDVQATSCQANIFATINRTAVNKASLTCLPKNGYLMSLIFVCALI